MRQHQMPREWRTVTAVLAVILCLILLQVRSSHIPRVTDRPSLPAKESHIQIVGLIRPKCKEARVKGERLAGLQEHSMCCEFCWPAILDDQKSRSALLIDKGREQDVAGFRADSSGNA